MVLLCCFSQLVLVFGKEINGAKSWFELGGLSLQPSEFAKFATALALAGYLNTKRQDLTRLKVIIPAVAIIFLPALLIALQPDMGSSVVFFALFIVLFREGMSPYIFVSGLLMIILFFLTLVMNNLYLTIALDHIRNFPGMVCNPEMEIMPDRHCNISPYCSGDISL